jgi:hypothetical protein
MDGDIFDLVPIPRGTTIAKLRSADKFVAPSFRVELKEPHRRIVADHALHTTSRIAMEGQHHPQSPWKTPPPLFGVTATPFANVRRIAIRPRSKPEYPPRES